MTVAYKITNFDQDNGQITLYVEGIAPIAIDLPIDDEGNVPTGEALTEYLGGFIPTWHFDRKKRLAQGIRNGSEIAALVEPEPITEATIEQLAASVRARRNIALITSDWTQTLDAPINEIERPAWASYRQQLRDMPEQEGFPVSVVWPISPEAEPQ